MGQAAVSPSGVRQAALSGVRWYAVVRVVAEVTSLATSVVLARLIAPEEFGSVAIALGIASLATGLFSPGLSAPLVQRAEIGRREMETTSGLAVAAAALLVVLLGVLGPLVAGPVFGERAADLLRLLTLVFPLLAIGVVPNAILQRHLAFRRLSAFELVGQLATAVVAVFLAVAGARGEAIIAGQIAGTAVQAVLMCASAPLARPRIHLQATRELLGFGASAGLASVVYSAYRNVDYVILGARLGAAELGYYWRAFQLGVEYQSKVSRVMLQLAFPIYSRMGDIDAIRRMRTRIVRVHATVLFPPLALLAATAPVLIPFLYGDRWEPAVVPTQILSVAGLVAVVGTGGGPLLMAAGKPRSLLGLNLTAMSLLALVVYFAAPHGIVAVCVGVVVYQLAFLAGLQVMLHRLIGIPLGALVPEVGPALVGSLVLFAVAAGLTELLSTEGAPAVALLPTVGVAAAITYLAVLRAAFPAAWADLMLLCGTLVPERALPSRFRRRRPSPVGISGPAR
jgi:PST family polysaccharide transporter